MRVLLLLLRADEHDGRPSAQAHGTSVDIFALGVLLNELFAREVPWDGYDPMEIKARARPHDHRRERALPSRPLIAPLVAPAPRLLQARVLRSERPPVPHTMPRVCEGLLRKAWHQTAALRPKAEALIKTLGEVEDSLPLGKSLGTGLSARGPYRDHAAAGTRALRAPRCPVGVAAVRANLSEPDAVLWQGLGVRDSLDDFASLGVSFQKKPLSRSM